MRQPDMGTAVVVCCAGAAVLFAAGMPVQTMAVLGAGAAASPGSYMATSVSYRAARITSFLQPLRQCQHHRLPVRPGHHRPRGRPLAGYGDRPEPGQLGLFAQPVHRLHIRRHRPGDRLCRQRGRPRALCRHRRHRHPGRLAGAQTTFESLLAAGITAWLVSQAVINIGAVAGVLPVTGVPLPFVSYGGTSLIIVLFAAGLLANVARRAVPRPPVGPDGPVGPGHSVRPDHRSAARRSRRPGTRLGRHRRRRHRGSPVPGMAVARALMERGHTPLRLHFVGVAAGRRGQDAGARRVPRHAVARPGPVPAPVCPQPGRQPGAPPAWLVGGGHGRRLFARWRPAVVVSLGGYASLPCVVAACAVAGASGCGQRRCRARSCQPVGVEGGGGLRRGWPRRQPCPGPWSPGCPCGRTWPAPSPQPGRAPGGPGSGSVFPRRRGWWPCREARSGSRRINRATLELARLWAGRHDVAIRHIVGRRDWEEFRSAGGPNGPLVYQQVPYEEDMASLYSAADVAVQRAGANTVAELALAGVPSVLVPLPGSPGDHQGANARAMADAGGAVVVAGRRARRCPVGPGAGGFVGHARAPGGHGRRRGALARPDAAAAVARLAE